MVDTAIFPPHPEEDGIIRQTEHRAVRQPGRPQAASATENYADAYQRTTPQEPTPPRQEYVPTHTEHNTKTDTVPPQPAAQASSQTHVPYEPHFPGMSKPITEQVVLEWEAPSRPFKKRSRQYFSTILIIGLLISMILFFAGQVLPIAVVIAVVFLVYVLSVFPPGTVWNEITTYGIRIEDHLYYWEELGRFWFTDKQGQKLLHIEVARFPGRLTLLMAEIPEEDMTELLSEVLLHQKPEPTFYEKGAKWLQEKVPLE